MYKKLKEKISLGVKILCIAGVLGGTSGVHIPLACSPDAVAISPQQAFVTAVNARNWNAAEAAINDGADVNMLIDAEHLFTALYIAAEEDDIDAVRMLLRHHANVNLADYENQTPLHRAAANSCIEVAHELLAQRGINVDALCAAVDGSSMTPLMLAASNNELNIVADLIRHGANVNARNANRQTALMFSMDGDDNAAIVDYLVRNGANVNAQDVDGETALIYAARSGWLNSVIVLLQWNADVNRQNNDGETALDMARTYGRDDIVRLLRNHQRMLELNR